MNILKEKIEKLFKHYEFGFGDENYEFKYEIDKKLKFFNVLADKINLNPTEEKLFFFYLFLSYTLKDEVDFYYKSKKVFLRNFIFKKIYSARYVYRQFDYVSPVSMSFYCPEFYETINEIFEGEDVSLPYDKKDRAHTVMTKEEKEEMAPFFSVLDEIEEEMKKDENLNFTTILAIKWLKSAAYNVEDENWFYTAFRKIEVLESDNVVLDYTDLEKFELDDEMRTSKDAMIWNMLNSRFFLNFKNIDKYIAIDDMFFDKLSDFFKTKEIVE